jgi:hypothetical protein
VATHVRVRPSHRHNHRDGREATSVRFGDLVTAPAIGASRQRHLRHVQGAPHRRQGGQRL